MLKSVAVSAVCGDPSQFKSAPIVRESLPWDQLAPEFLLWRESYGRAASNAMIGRIQLETMPREREMSVNQYQSMGLPQMALHPFECHLCQWFGGNIIP